MLFLAILVFLSALIIAGCAAYFSIVGMTLLFVGSGMSIIVMGGALELGKLVAVSFLHQQWEKVGFLLKTYLILASIVLSAITSVGIYGYLAAGYNATNIKVKGYEKVIEGNNRSIEQIKQEIDQLSVIPDNSKEIELTNTNKNNFIKQQLDLIEQKQKRIVELQNTIPAERKKYTDEINLAKTSFDQETEKETGQIKLFNDRLTILDKEVQVWMDQGTGGLFKQNGLEKARETKRLQESERAQIDVQIKSKQNNIESLRVDYNNKIKDSTKSLDSRIKAIEDKITSVEQDITKDKQAIETYQAKISEELNTKFAQTDTKVKESRTLAKEKEKEIQSLQKANTETQTKIIETDVGTFKFVANSVGLTLDQTVNWFIWSIMFVFDPLAVTLIICFNHLIKHRKKPEVIPLTKKELPATIAPVVSAAPLIETKTEIKEEPAKPHESVYGVFDDEGSFNVGPGHNKVPGH